MAVNFDFDFIGDFDGTGDSGTSVLLGLAASRFLHISTTLVRFGIAGASAAAKSSVSDMLDCTGELIL
jgi:hypothetical protein